MPRSLEIRAGVVLYGGSSLAVYMGGVVGELLRMVKASREDDEGRVLPYADLLKALDAHFTVDVLSGTSAGGVNGVFLARALATGGDLDFMGNLWRDVGDAATLLDWSGGQPDSILNGQYFHEALRNALGQIAKPGGRRLVDVLDLHLTATDIQGRYWQRRDDLGHEILGREHRKLFHLKLRTKFKLANPANPNEPTYGYEQNDFADEQDRPEDEKRLDRLAKLSRTSAAFPGMFAPMGYTRDEAYPPQEAPDTIDHRNTFWMTDGGVLMNHPFEPVIDTIFHRHATRPVERLLFYVEPTLTDRGVPAGKEGDQKPNALKTVLSALELPSYQGIAADLNRIGDHNREVQHLRQLVREMEGVVEGSRPVRAPQLKPYLALRKDRMATDWKARLRIAGRALEAKFPPFAARLKGCADGDWDLNAVPDKDLDLHDFRFQERRLHFLIEQLGCYYQALATSAGEYVEPAELRQWLDQQMQVETLLWKAVEDLRHQEWCWWSWTPAEKDAAQGETLFDLLQATPVREITPDLLQRSLGSLLKAWQGRCVVGLGIARALEAAAAPPPFRSRVGTLSGGRAAISPPPSFLAMWKQFQAYDLLLYPLAIGSSLGERDDISWVRISPYDADSLLREDPVDGAPPASWAQRDQFGATKLAGDSLGNFGGFLSRRWRGNDYMWGRLDAADLMIASLVKRAQSRVPAARFAEIKQVAARARVRAFRDVLKAELAPADLERLAAYAADPVYARDRDYTVLVDQALRQSRDSAAVAALVRGLRHRLPSQNQADLLARTLDQLADELDKAAAARQEPAENLQTALAGILKSVDEVASATVGLAALPTGAPASPAELARLDPVQRTFRARQAVDTLEWPALRRFLLTDYRTGRETPKDLHPAILANTAVDAAQNLDHVIRNMITDAGVKVPGVVSKVGDWFSRAIRWVRGVVKMVLPRPAKDADDRSPGWLRIAGGLLVFVAGVLAEGLRTWDGSLDRLLLWVGAAGVLAGLLVAWSFRAPLARFFRATPPLSLGILLLAILSFLVGDSQTLSGVTWKVSLWGEEQQAIPLVRSFGIALGSLWGGYNGFRTLALWLDRFRRTPVSAFPAAVRTLWKVNRVKGGAPVGVALDEWYRVVVASADGLVRRRQGNDWVTLGQAFQGAARAVVADPAGGLLVVADGGVYRWGGSPERWQLLASLRGAVSLTAAGSDIWVSTGVRGQVYRLVRQPGEPGTVVSVLPVGRFASPSGLAVRVNHEYGMEVQRLVVVESLPGRVTEVNLNGSADRRVLARLGPLAFPRNVGLLADGRLLVSTARGPVRIVDPTAASVTGNIDFQPDVLPHGMIEEAAGHVWFAGAGRGFPGRAKGHSVGLFIVPPAL